MADRFALAAWEKFRTLLFPVLITSSFFNNGLSFRSTPSSSSSLTISRVITVIATAMAAGVTVEAMGGTEEEEGTAAAVTTTRWVTLAGASEP